MNVVVAKGTFAAVADCAELLGGQSAEASAAIRNRGGNLSRHPSSFVGKLALTDASVFHRSGDSEILRRAYDGKSTDFALGREWEWEEVWTVVIPFDTQKLLWWKQINKKKIGRRGKRGRWMESLQLSNSADRRHDQ